MRLVLFCFTLLISGIAAAAVLNPELKPNGSYDKPVLEIGKPAKPEWTETTVKASVNHKPVQGKQKTLIGEIIDVSCYNQVGKHGVVHKACGMGCATGGAPIGLLTEDGTVYLISPEEHDPRRDQKTTLRPILINYMASIVKVHGTVTNVDGVKTVYVQGYTK